MTSKVFLIGFGGAGTAIVKDIESTNHGSFIYRCLDISNNGTVTEENHDQAWEKFFNPGIKSFNLHYDSLRMTPDRLKNPSVLFSIVRKYCTKYSSKYQVALIAGLGRRTGSATILTFATALSYDVRLDLPSSIDRAAFVITPFDFEGKINKRKSEKTLSNLKKILPETKISICKNQDLMSNSKDLNLQFAYQILHNAVKDQITYYFSLKKGNPIIKQHGFPNLVSSKNNNSSIVPRVFKSILNVTKTVSSQIYARFSITQKSANNSSRSSKTIKSAPQNTDYKTISEVAEPDGFRKKNRYGTATYANGDKYVGDWEDGKRTGQGTYTYADGEKYVGEWKDDQNNGQGTYTWPDGEKYVGEWKDDQNNGQGTFTWPDGEKYVGEWKNGKRTGQGTFTYADGRITEGIWKDNELEAGKGVKVAPKGDTSTKPKGSPNELLKNTQKKEEAPNDISVVKEKQKLLPKFIKSVFKLSAYAIFIFAVMLGGFVAIKGYQLDDQSIHAAITQPNALIRIDEKGGARLRSCMCDRTLKPSELPETFKQALITIEDKRFYQHTGFDIRSLGRAILSLGARGGGSTLEMQLVKNSIVQPKQDIARKVSEIILAYRISRIFEKDDIIRLYASRVNFGNVGGTEITGLRSAANYFFGKRPQDITIEEAAILVAMLKSPTGYHPIKRSENNLRRAQKILKLLVLEGKASEAAVQRVKNFMPKKGNIMPFRDRYTEDLIIREVGKLGLTEGNYRFVLSLDPIAQMQALNILDKAVNSGRSRGVERASLVSLDKNGAIKAIIGGQNYLKNSYNLATQAERQAASTMKIVTYLSALERGHSKATKVWDDPSKIKRFKVRNSNGKYAGETILEHCFAKSKNVCTYYIAEQLTRFENLSEMSYRLHLTSKETEGDSIVLGVAETTLLKNTAAFASIKNQGFHMEPYLIRFVLGEYGGLVYEHVVDREYVFSKNVAAQMKELLDKVVSPSGTANSALIPGYRTFGKTGTSQKNRDAWFVGFTEHDITTGVWVGPTDDGFMRGVSGGNVPAQIFRKFNQNLYERYEFCGPNFMMQSSGYGRDVNC